MSKHNCDCNTYYFFSDKPLCLHKLFRRGYIKAITRKATYSGVEFYIWKSGYRGLKYGPRAKLFTVEQVKLAIELANKYKVQKVRL